MVIEGKSREEIRNEEKARWEEMRYRRTYGTLSRTGNGQKICDETGGKRQRCRKKRYLPGTFIDRSSTCIENEKKILFNPVIDRR